MSRGTRHEELFRDATREGIEVIDFPAVPIDEPAPAALTQLNLAAGSGLQRLVLARYDMPQNYEGILNYALLAQTNSGQLGPNPGMSAQLVICAGGTQGTPKGDLTTLSTQESQAALMALSDQVGTNLPILSGNNSPAIVAHNFYAPSNRRIIATAAIMVGSAPSTWLLWGRLFGFRWPINSLTVDERLRLLTFITAGQW